MLTSLNTATASPSEPPGSPRQAGRYVIILVLAIFVAWPAIRGEFVGGDYHRLVLNHVLVNHPSVAHAIELFQIVHRDLYQPLPLLTFQLEFLVANAFGMFDRSVEAGAWLFHFDNMWLHALNALLVFSLVRRLVEGAKGAAADRLALIAAVLFACHPLQVEVIAWINGRMMLLSTLFALLSVLSFDRFLQRGGFARALLSVVLALLSAISKVRVGLPPLMLLAAWATHRRIGARGWLAWGCSTLVIGAFAVVNIHATAEADMFEGGAEQLHGPTPVRAGLAMAHYFRTLVWPVGLGSYYPAPITVEWWSASTLTAGAVTLVGVALMVLVAWRVRACGWAVPWFFFGIADTLPFVPARNILAADRYLYLPIIGLVVLAAAVADAVFRRAGDRVRSPRFRVASWMTTCALLCLFLGIGWRVADTYTTALKKTLRTATTFPHEPRVWERAGWAYHRAGYYPEAIEFAQRELVHDNAVLRSAGLQLWGMSELRRGNVDEGLRLLHRAREIAPKDPLAVYRLAAAYDELGRWKDALPLFEASAEYSPGDNVTLRRLAALYRREGRLDEARQLYERSLTNNAFDIEAAVGLVELDVEAATTSSYAAAEQRLRKLLDHLPEDARLNANLGMIRFLEERADDAMKLASRAFVALIDARYAMAAARVDELCELSTSEDARSWLLTALQRHDEERPGEPWTIGLATRLLIVDGQLDAAEAFLGLFQKQCASEECRAYSDRLATELIAARTVSLDPSPAADDAPP